jgi:lipoprotein-anchoring transpeptidase ErfK/SrfK
MTWFLLLTLAAAQPHKAPPHRAPQPVTRARCTDAVAFQVRLDRVGFSVGEIDGTSGANLHHALAAYQEKKKLPGGGQLNCDTLHALEQDFAEPIYSDYTVTERDAAGPFLEHPLPTDLTEQGNLPALSYESLTEAIAERFHASPRLLTRLNPHVNLAAGTKIRVPNVTPFDSATRPRSEPANQITVRVSRARSTLQVEKSNGDIVMFAPVTSGSEHDPLPIGNWHVTGIAWLPVFHYNPELFWDANPADPKTSIAAGPNNPVGVVWIDINVPHYGLHGTPYPDAIGHAQSHGCVRLTNWDAARLASMVRAGTPVVFEE